MAPKHTELTAYNTIDGRFIFGLTNAGGASAARYFVWGREPNWAAVLGGGMDAPDEIPAGSTIDCLDMPILSTVVRPGGKSEFCYLPLSKTKPTTKARA